MEEEVFLPEPVIQRIQSFMNRKQAVQTTILSKSWHQAWLTHPHLSMFIPRHPKTHRFRRFAKKTFRRIRESNQTIESFTLTVHLIAYFDPELLAYDMISNAMELGAKHLNIKFREITTRFIPPLDSPTLASLSVENCKINVEGSCPTSSGMKSMSLKNVWIDSDDVFRHIPSCIEELSCDRLMLANLTNMLELPKLRCLSLGNMRVDAAFFTDFSSKFPCLKRLSLVRCYARCLKIASASVEHIVYMPRWVADPITFEVPNIRTFSYVGCTLLRSFLSLEAAESREWEFAVRIRRRTAYFRPPWLLKLNESLKSFTTAKISLSLHFVRFSRHKHGTDSNGVMKHLPEPVVLQSLSTNIDQACMHCSDIFYRLFEVGRV